MPSRAATSTVVEIQESSAKSAAPGFERHRAVDVEWLRRQVLAALPHLNHPAQRISVMIVNDAEMARLHRDHCRLEGTTDVLTFPLSTPQEPIDVDIAVCVDEAARRAAEFHHDINRELLLYIVHGLLHAIGHDDHSPEGHARMHGEEDRILQAIGVGAVFQSAKPDRATGSNA